MHSGLPPSSTATTAELNALLLADTWKKGISSTFFVAVIRLLLQALKKSGNTCQLLSFQARIQQKPIKSTN